MQRDHCGPMHRNRDAHASTARSAKQPVATPACTLQLNSTNPARDWLAFGFQIQNFNLQTPNSKSKIQKKNTTKTRKRHSYFKIPILRRYVFTLLRRSRSAVRIDWNRCSKSIVYFIKIFLVRNSIRKSFKPICCEFVTVPVDKVPIANFTLVYLALSVVFKSSVSGD